MDKLQVTEWRDEAGRLHSRWPGNRGYWQGMVPIEAEVPNRTMLLLGVCANTVGRLAIEAFHDLQLTLVDIQANDGVPGLIVQDAQDFVAACAGHFDFVAVDIFTDGGAIPEFVLSEPFVVKLAAIATTVCLNAIDDDLEIPAYLAAFADARPTMYAGNQLWRLKH